MAINEHISRLNSGVPIWNKWREENPETLIDLKNANLQQISLQGVNLSNVNLSGANLRLAILIDANLSGSNLIAANLEGADLSNAILLGAKLKNVRLKGTLLSESCLKNINIKELDLAGARLPGVDFSNCNLENLNFKDSDLKSTVFSEANLKNVNFSGADLSGAKLNGALLENVKLTGANLKNADFQNAIFRANEPDSLIIYTPGPADIINLKETKFEGTNIEGVDFRYFDFSGANITGLIIPRSQIEDLRFTGAVFDPEDKSVNPKNYRYPIKLGVNGIYNAKNKTVALAEQYPDPDSMLGNNPDSVIESLKRARHFLTSSLGMVAIVLLLVFSNSNNSFKIYEVMIPQNLVKTIAMIISVGALILCSSFLADGLKGAKYVKTQEGAMKVGNFPWMISRYGSSNRYLLNNWVIRVIMIFHPLVYVLNLFGSISEKGFEINLMLSPLTIFHIFLLVTMTLLSIRIYSLSQKFQTPILFDQNAENVKKSDIEKQTEALVNILNKFSQSKNS